ncbi:MAG TPA: tyrosine-type recombinase/integrase [Gaiellales bacterium]|jgi:site-specific recombinase XerD
MLLDAATAAYLRALEGANRSPETIQNAATYLAGFARAAFDDDDPDVASVEPSHVESWVAEMRGRGLRSSSISTAISSLSAFLRWCENQGHLASSPMRRVLRPSAASSVDDDYAYLDDDQLELLLRVARDGWDREVAGLDDRRDEARRREDFLICSLMGLAGLRVSEVCALDSGDVSERHVLIRAGKGNRRRSVPTDPTIWQALELHRPAGLHLFGMPTDPSRRITRNALEVRISRLARYAGLGRVTPHVLRHSFATAVGRDPQAVVVLRDLLGHRSVNTTSRYLHSRDDERRAVLAEARARRLGRTRS